MESWRVVRAAERGRGIASDAPALAAAVRRPAVPQHAAILTAAGFDPEQTVAEVDGHDWGLEAYAGLREASILRHVPLAHLGLDDVNLLLFWGSDAAPLIELALHYLHRNPFQATNGRTLSALLVNVAEAVCLPSLPFDPAPNRLRYGARLAAVCAQARAMLADGSAEAAAAELHDSPVRVLSEAQSHLSRHRHGLHEGLWRDS
jgi:hypothetical protein